MRNTRWLAALCAGTMLAAACAPSASNSGSGSGSGGTVTYLLSGELPSLDPVSFTVPGNPSLLAPRALAIFDALAVEDSATGRLEMRIAQSITSTDDVTWTLKLRPNVKFSDGTALDAAAVEFNWKRLADPADHAPMGLYARKIVTMTATDPLTLQVRLKGPDSAFQQIVARDLTFIGSPRAIQAEGAKFAQKPVGAGPYRVTEFVPDDHLTLDRNPDYYGTTHVNRIIFKTVTDETQRVNTLLTGGADAMFSADPNTAAQARRSGFGIARTTLNGGNDILFNVRKAPFDDLRARQAIALALDPRALSSVLDHGQAPTVDTLFVPTSPFYDASIRQAAPNRAQAQALLTELATAGKPLHVSFLVPQSFATSAEWFQAQLAMYKDLSVTLQVLPDAQVAPVAARGGFQAAFLASSWLGPNPSLLSFYGTGGTQNWGGYSSPVVDKELAIAEASRDEAVQKAAFTAIQRELVRDLPSVFYTRPVYLVIYNKRLHGVTTVGDGSPLWTSLWTSS